MLAHEQIELFSAEGMCLPPFWHHAHTAFEAKFRVSSVAEQVKYVTAQFCNSKHNYELPKALGEI